MRSPLTVEDDASFIHIGLAVSLFSRIIQYVTVCGEPAVRAGRFGQIWTVHVASSTESTLRATDAGRGVMSTTPVVTAPLGNASSPLPDESANVLAPSKV